jgi:hypothetical protein
MNKMELEKIISPHKIDVQGLGIYEVYLPEQVLEIIMTIEVSKINAIKYAEFCVRCDREGLPLIGLDDFLKLI